MQFESATLTDAVIVSGERREFGNLAGKLAKNHERNNCGRNRKDADTIVKSPQTHGLSIFALNRPSPTIIIIHDHDER